ncbi:MAG: hypothetical protein ACLR8P_05180 [Clostridium fessum]
MNREGDRYEEKFWLILYHLGGSVVLLLLLYTSLQGLTTVTLCLAIPVLVASIMEAKFEWKFLRENPEIKKDKTYRIAKTLWISLWSYFGGRSMASSLEHFCLIKDSVTLGLNREVIDMKKKFWLTLYNLGVSILFLLSLYSYAKGMAGFSLFLALAVFGEIAARAFIECKYLQESPEIKEDTAFIESRKYCDCFLKLS